MSAYNHESGKTAKLKTYQLQFPQNKCIETELFMGKSTVTFIILITVFPEIQGKVGGKNILYKNIYMR